VHARLPEHGLLRVDGNLIVTAEVRTPREMADHVPLR